MGCNHLLGKARDSVEILFSSIRYLRAAEARELLPVGPGPHRGIDG